MVPHCGFDLHFSDNEWCWASFHVFVTHLYVFFRRHVCLVLWPIFWLSHLFFWYWAAWAACIFLRLILLSVTSFAIIVSHYEGCLFTLFIVSFIVQKLLSLIRSQLCLFLLLFPLLWEVDHRGSCCDLCHRVFCLFSSRSFIGSTLTFRSLIHFEFVIVYRVRKCSNFILLDVAVQFSQHHLLKRLSLPIVYLCLLCQK